MKRPGLKRLNLVLKILFIPLPVMEMLVVDEAVAEDVMEYHITETPGLLVSGEIVDVEVGI